MKIVHFADLHLGVENYGRTDPKTGLSTRLGDFLAVFDQVTDYAINEGADLVLFAGDAYKSRDPSQTHQRELARRVATLAKAGIPVFLLVGNHDQPQTFARATALDIFRTLPVPTVTVGDGLKTYLIETTKGPLQVVSLPWVRRAAFLSRDEAKALSLEQVNKAMESRLTDFIRDQAESLNARIPSVLVGHVTLSSAEKSSEQGMILTRDYELVPSSVAHSAFDYVALGHIHKHQVLHQSPRVAYSGSLQRVDFSEEKDTKGFCVVELDTSKRQGARLDRFDFQAVDARTFVTIDAELQPGDPEPLRTVQRAIARKVTKDAVVRLRLKLPADLAPQVPDAELRHMLEDAHYVAGIYRDIERPERPIRTGYTRGSGGTPVQPREALETYLSERAVSEAQRSRLLEAADDLIREEEHEREGKH